MKKLLALLTAGIMVFSLASCGEKVEDVSSDDLDVIEEQTEVEEVEAGPLTVGDFTVTAEEITPQQPFEVPFNNEPDMAVFGDTVYVSDGDSTVKVYTLADNTLTYIKDLEIPCKNGIQVDKDSNIYAGGGVFEAKIYDADGNEIGAAAASGAIAVSKTEDFALTYWSGRDEVTKIAGGAAEPWVITGMNSGGSIFTDVSEIEIQNGHVLVGGEDDDKYLMAAYDTAGNQLAVSEEPLDGMLPNALCETANGFIATASYDMNFIAPDGSLISNDIDADELFGVSGRCWIRNLTPLSDGTVLVCAACKKDDSTDTIRIFKLSGF